MIDYVPGDDYEVDEVLVFSDLGFSVHVYEKRRPEANRDYGIHWLNYRLLEHDLGGDEPHYPTAAHTRGIAKNTTPDARSLEIDTLAEGYLKWDGCREIRLSGHFCGSQNFEAMVQAFRRLWVWASEKFGFEECDIYGEATNV
jgi:hypothetical protein